MFILEDVGAVRDVGNLGMGKRTYFRPGHHIRYMNSVSQAPILEHTRWQMGNLTTPDTYYMDDLGLGDLGFGFKKFVSKGIKAHMAVGKKTVGAHKSVIRKLPGGKKLVRSTDAVVDKATGIAKKAAPIALPIAAVVAAPFTAGTSLALLGVGVSLAAGAGSAALAAHKSKQAAKKAAREEEKSMREQNKLEEDAEWIDLLNKDPDSFLMAYRNGDVPASIVSKTKRALGSNWSTFINEGRGDTKNRGGTPGSVIIDDDESVPQRQGRTISKTPSKISPAIPIAVGVAALVMMNS